MFKVIDTLELCDNLVCKLEDDTKYIWLMLYDGERCVYKYGICNNKKNSVLVNDLGSGKSSDGKYYISLGLEHDDMWHFELALIYHDNDVIVYSESNWSDEEWGYYYEFSPDSNGFEEVAIQ